MEGEPGGEIEPSTLLGDNYEARMKIMVKNISADYEDFQRLYERTDFLNVMEMTAINNAVSFAAKENNNNQKSEAWQESQ